MAFYDKYYDAISGGYDELYGEEQRLKYLFLIDWLADLQGSTLDVGSGTGIITEFFEPSVLTDRSMGMLKLAEGYRIVCDARFLPFKNECFNNITCFTVLQDIIDKRLVIREFHRVCTDKVIVTITKKLKAREELEKLFIPFKLLQYREQDKDHCFLLSK